MKQIFVTALSAVFISILALCFGQPVFAHGDAPRIEISTERLNPGSMLEIRGVDFESEEEVTLALIGSQVEHPLGEALGDEEGIFVLMLSLPRDLATGTYIVRATTDDHVVDSPQITVWGVTVSGDGEEGSREEEDGLLAPMPTFAPGVSSTPLPEIVTEETFAPKSSSNTAIYSILTGVLLIALLGVGILRKR